MRVIRYRLNQVKLGIDESVNVLPRRIAARYGKGHKDTIKIFDVEIIRDSIDARRKSDIKKVYTVDFSSDVKLDLPEAPDMSYKQVEAGKEIMERRPVIIGFGPCGMFCALILAERGYRPLVLERGYAMEDRIREVKAFWEKGILNPE